MTAWSLSDDRRTLTIRIPDPDGTRTVTLGWAEPATDDQVTAALAYPRLLVASARPQPGQCNTTRRRELFGGTLWIHTMTGPPTWRWPRCYRSRDRALVVGWLQHGWAVKWKRGWADRDAVDG